MRKVLALLAGLTIVTGVAFAAETTTGAVHIEREKVTTGVAVHIEKDRTTDGAVHIEKDRTTTKGSVHVEIDKTTDGAVHVEKVRTTTDGAIISKKEFDRTTDGAIKGSKQEGKGNNFGQQREKNPIAEGNKAKIESLTDEQKLALKAQAEEMKAAREKEVGNKEKKGKFGKNKQ